MLPLKYVFRNLTVRKTASFFTMATITITVFLFLLVTVVTTAISSTFTSSGKDINAMILRAGTVVEFSSVVTQQELDILQSFDEIARKDGKSVISPELMTMVLHKAKKEEQFKYVTIRGIGPMALRVHGDLKFVKGKMLNFGTNEAIVSQQIANRFVGLDLGDTLTIRSINFKIVGVFDSGGKMYDSEVWMDANSLKSAKKQDFFSVVFAELKDKNQLASLDKKLTADRRLALKAVQEKEFYEKQHQATQAHLEVFGQFIYLIMAIGVGFAVMNSMYTAISRRTREMAVLQVVGFSKFGVATNFLLEALVVSFGGVLLAILIALPLNQVSLAMSNMSRLSDITFSLSVTPKMMLEGAIFGVGVALVGSVFPIVRALRLKIVDGLRAL